VVRSSTPVDMSLSTSYSSVLAKAPVYTNQTTLRASLRRNSSRNRVGGDKLLYMTSLAENALETTVSNCVLHTSSGGLG